MKGALHLIQGLAIHHTTLLAEHINHKPSNYKQCENCEKITGGLANMGRGADRVGFGRGVPLSQ